MNNTNKNVLHAMFHYTINAGGKTVELRLKISPACHKKIDLTLLSEL
jgi:hypothetical protein